MMLVSVPPIDANVALVGITVAAVLVTLILLVIRNRQASRLRSRPDRREQPRSPEQEKVAQPTVQVLPVAQLISDDGSALLAAVREAEAEGADARLAGLYLSLAQRHLDDGQAHDAAELMRKSIRAAAASGQKGTHAKARVALGDLVQVSGDPATACEHWQIARTLFHELGQRGDFDAVDARMLRNGCPSDWVLTDF